MRRTRSLVLAGFVVAALALCVALGGCGANSASKFVGTWKATSLSSYGNDVSEDTFKQLEQTGMMIFLDVKADGNLTIKQFGEEISGTYTMDHDKLKVKFPSESMVDEGIGSLDNDTLSLTSSDGSVTFKFSKSSADEMGKATTIPGPGETSATTDAATTSAATSSATTQAQ